MGSVKCYLCKSEATFFQTKDNYGHFKCKNVLCEFIFVFPNFIDLEQIYDHSVPCKDSIPSSEAEVFKITKNIRYIRKLIKKEKIQKLLDIGCGDGHLLLALKNLDVNAFGIEANTKSAIYCKKRGLDVKNDFFKKDSFKGKQFQLINLGDIIEHVADPHEFIQNVLSILEVNGIIVIRTPNLGSFWSKLTYIITIFTTIPWSSLTPPKHLSNFSTKNMVNLLKSYDLEILKIFFESPKLIYELGQLHLLRDFKNSKSLTNLCRLFLGYALYLIIFLLTRFFKLIFSNDFSQTITVRKVV